MLFRNMLRKQNLKLFSVFILSILVLTFMSFSVYGAVLSISDATIKSNYEGFSKAWIVSMISDDYTTDSLTAHLTPQDFKDESGTASKQSLNIGVTTKPNYCTYSFKINSFNYQDVYNVQPVHIKRFWQSDFINDVKSQCADFSKPDYKITAFSPSEASNYVWVKVGIVYYEAWCVKLNEKLGTVAQPIDKKIIAESDWSVTAEGKTSQKATISNSESGDGRSTKLGDNVWIQWQGSLVTGEDCPDVSNLIGIHSNSNTQGWKFASRDTYNTYSSYLTTGIRSDIQDYGKGSTSEELFKQRANGIINAVNVEKKDFTYSILNSSVNSGKVRIELGRNIIFPLFRLIINANYLEINIPTGKPQITKVEDIKFAEGLAGQENVEIKNIGNDKGGFTTRIINCQGGFSSSTSPIGSILDAGQSATLTFNIIGSTTSEQAEVKGKCTVEMKESITGEKVTKDFGITMEQIKECTPETYACSIDPVTGNQAIKVCNTAGTKYEIIEVCQAGFECKLTSDGKANCIDPEFCKNHPNDPKCIDGGKCGRWLWGLVPDYWCLINQWILKARIWFAVVAGFLLGLIGTTYVGKILKGIRGEESDTERAEAKKSRMWISLITFLIIGLSGGVLAYFTFWFIVIAIIILGGIRILI